MLSLTILNYALRLLLVNWVWLILEEIAEANFVHICSDLLVGILGSALRTFSHVLSMAAGASLDKQVGGGKL